MAVARSGAAAFLLAVTEDAKVRWPPGFCTTGRPACTCRRSSVHIAGKPRPIVAETRQAGI
jgi:hypothetical protein